MLTIWNSAGPLTGFFKNCGNLKQFSQYCLYLRYGRPQMIASCCVLEGKCDKKGSDKNTTHLRYHLDFSSHVEWSKVVHKEQPTYNVRSSYEICFDSKVRFRMIAKNYVSIMFLYLQFIDYGSTK